MAGFTKSEIEAAEREEKRDVIYRKYIHRNCLLNGDNAAIYAHGDFALIVQDGKPHLSAEFAWETVEFIMEHKEGKFYV